MEDDGLADGAPCVGHRRNMMRTDVGAIGVGWYKPAIDAGLLTVMMSFSSWNGEKHTGNRSLITDVLKGRMGFTGFVINDWNSHGQDGVRSVMKEGGSSRVAAVTKLVKSLGGKVEAFYFAYGGCDAYVLVDVSDEAAALALTLAVNASGAVTLEMVPLITAKQMDQATQKTVKYKAPGA